MKIKKGDSPELKLKKIDGSDFDLNNFKGKKVYLKYMRFASCMFCNLEVNHLKNKHSEFGKDFEIVLVFHSSVEFLNKQMKKHGPLPFTVLADPDFTYYKKYEIDRSMTKLMNAFIFKFPKALSAMLKGYIPIKLGGYLDIMTADFFLDKEGVVIRSKYSEKDAFDGFELSEIKEFSLR